MAVPMENSLSLGLFPDPERNSLTKQRQRSVKKSVNKSPLLQTNFSTPESVLHLYRRMQLQQYLQELNERECSAQLRNKQLLQQFEEAQDTLKDMLASNAVMKMIRVEYERYLQENYPRWEQQIEERKRQTAHRTTMEDHLRSYLTDTEWVTKFSRQHLPSQGLTSRPQQIPTPQEHLHYSQAQITRLPMGAPYQAHSSSQVPTPLRPQPVSSHLYPFLPHNFSSAPSHHNRRPMQDPLDWTTLLADQPWSWAAGVAGIPTGSESLLGQINMNKPPPEAGDSTIVGQEEDEEEGEASKAPSLPKERSGGSKRSHASQDLDFNPVRLSSGHPDSSESGRDSGLVGKEKRKKRGRIQHSSADKDKHSSQDASCSIPGVVTPVTMAQSSESDASSEKQQSISSSRRMKRGVGSAVGREKIEVKNERSLMRKDDSKNSSEGSRHAGEERGSSSEKSKVGNQSPDNKSESSKEESESQEEGDEEDDEEDDDDDDDEEEESNNNSLKIEKGAADQKKKQESQSSEVSSTDDKEGENKGNMDAVEDEENQNVEEDKVSARKTTTEDEEESDAEEEDGVNNLEDEDAENKQQVSVESQDEEEEEENPSEEGSDEEEDEESDHEEEHREDEGEAEEERDSDDSIISPKEKRPKQMQVILEEAVEEEEEEGSKAESSNNDSEGFSDEDIENLLAPQEPRQKEKNDLKQEEKKPTDVSERVQIFQVQQKESKADHQSDSDEFDHFYD